MVRSITFGLIFFGFAGPVSAQTVDWRRAGGDLFAATLVEEASASITAEAEPVMGGDLDDPERQAFTNLNVPFAPEQPHTMTSWSSRANNPPLSDWYRLLTSDTATAETREQARTVLAWARDNIKLGKQDTKVINAAIADFERRHLLDG